MAEEETSKNDFNFEKDVPMIMGIMGVLLLLYGLFYPFTEGVQNETEALVGLKNIIAGGLLMLGGLLFSIERKLANKEA